MSFKIITYRGWKRFWGRAFGWFSSQFESVKTALTDLDVDVDLSPVAKQDTLIDLYRVDDTYPNLFKVGLHWYASTGTWDSVFQIFQIVGMHTVFDQEYLAVELVPAVGGNVYLATGTRVTSYTPCEDTITEVRTVRYSQIFDLIGTPESGQASTLSGAIAAGSGSGAERLEQFFGLADSYEAQAKGGERTNNTVIDECKVRFQDAFNGLLPTGFTMPNSVTVDNLTYTGTTNS